MKTTNEIILLQTQTQLYRVSNPKSKKYDQKLTEKSRIFEVTCVMADHFGVIGNLFLCLCVDYYCKGQFGTLNKR